MHRTSLLLITALLVIPMTTAGTTDRSVSMEFGGPSHYWGAPTLTSGHETSFAVVTKNGTVAMWVEAGTKVTETIQTDYLVIVDAVVFTYRVIENGPLEVETYEVERAGWLMLTPAPERPMAVLSEIQSVRFETNRFSATTWDDQNTFSDASRADDFSLAYRAIPGWSRDGVLSISDDYLPTSITANEVEAISWTNAVVECIDLEPCPSSDDAEIERTGESVQSRRQVSISLERAHNLEFKSASAQTHLLSPEWSISGPMAARLPKASGNDCQAVGCDGVKTIRLDGEFTIDGMAKSGNDRLAAQIHGDVANLILDEQPVDPSLLWAIGAVSTVAVGAIVAAILNKLGLFGLFTRISPDEALEHPRRQVIYEYIVENPGTTFREMVRNTGIPAGTTRHHLNIMRRCDLVVEKPHRSTLRFFENHGKFEASWDTVVMLREPALEELHGWLRRHPKSPQKVIVAAMAERGHSRGTTQHRLCRLEDAGLVSCRHQGRLKLYTAHAEPQRRPPRPDEWTGLDASWPRRI